MHFLVVELNRTNQPTIKVSEFGTCYAYALSILFFFILSVIYLFEPGVASVTNAYKKNGLGWAGLGGYSFIRNGSPLALSEKPIS